MEAWADPGEPTEDEAFEKAILERKIFEISPKFKKHFFIFKIKKWKA